MKKPDLVWTGLVGAVIATVIVHILKPYFDLQRPAAVINNDLFQLTGPVYHYKSIPSGNTATIFTLTGILFYYVNSQYGKVGLLTFAILVELSRIAVGVHWPADILASAAIGYLAAIGGHYFVVLFKWKENKVVQLIVGFILLVAAFYLLLFYDSRYEQAFLLQHIIAISILILGIKEYYLILRG